MKRSLPERQNTLGDPTPPILDYEKPVEQKQRAIVNPSVHHLSLRQRWLMFVVGVAVYISLAGGIGWLWWFVKRIL